MKTANRNYDVKVDGRLFPDADVFTAFKNKDFFSSIEEQAKERYNRPGQFERIDHASRTIHLNY